MAGFLLQDEIFLNSMLERVRAGSMQRPEVLTGMDGYTTDCRKRAGGGNRGGPSWGQGYGGGGGGGPPRYGGYNDQPMSNAGNYPRNNTGYRDNFNVGIYMTYCFFLPSSLGPSEQQ